MSKLGGPSPCLPNLTSSQSLNAELVASSMDFSVSAASSFHSQHNCSDTHRPEATSNHASNEDNKVGINECSEAKTSTMNNSKVVAADNLVSNCFGKSEALGQGVGCCNADGSLLPAKSSGNAEFSSSERVRENRHEEAESFKEDFPPTPSDHQSILVSLSTRCVWKGTVCERAHLLRIKYYGSFDKPLGRFLRDHLFDHVISLSLSLSPLPHKNTLKY